MKFQHGVLLILCAALAGCTNDMKDDSKLKPYEESKLFTDKRSSRPMIENTIPRGYLIEEPMHTGKVNGKLSEEFPIKIDRQVLERGRQRYNIYCSVCHDAMGSGNGMIVRRGFRAPSSYHTERLRIAPPGYFFDIITNGFGMMFDYSAQIAPADRWAIVAYIRALQLSQYASVGDVPADQKGLLEKA